MMKQRYYHINHNRDVRTYYLPMRTLYYLAPLIATDGHSYPMIAYIDHDTLPSSLPHDLTTVPEPEPTHSAQQSRTHSASTPAPAAAPEPPPLSSPPSEDTPPPSPPSSPPSLPSPIMDLLPPLVLNPGGSSLHSSSIILPSSPSPLSSPKPPIYRLSMYLDILSPPPRHPRQTTANYAFTVRSARRSAALNLILHISSCTWRVLGFLYRLRRPARLRAAYRAATLRIISSPPTPLLGYDIGFSDLTSDLVLRTPTGNFISHHPSSPNLPLAEVAAYSPTGDAIPALVPPVESRLVLCPETSGSWCYYHVDHGSVMWHIPPDLLPSSSPLASATLPPLASFTAERPPPSLNHRFHLTLDNLERHTPWLPLYSDSDRSVSLYHKVTGCTRSAPWFTLRHSGQVYFANIVTGETRWAPPMGWRDGWLSLSSPFDRRSPYARSLIPPSLAKMHVEGGACYLERS